MKIQSVPRALWRWLSKASLIVNWRDVLLLLVVGVGLTLLAGMVDFVAARFGLGNWLPILSNYLMGFARFVGANVCASVLGMFAWPIIHQFGATGFRSVWDDANPETGFTPRHKALIILFVLGLEGLCAAICFAQ